MGSQTEPRAAAGTENATETGARLIAVPSVPPLPEPRRGIPKWVKVLATMVVVGGSLGYLLYATAAPEVEWYKHVDEVVAQRAALQGKKLQLHGRVVKGSILRKPAGASFEYRFVVENNGQTIAAHHTGLVPDTFKDEAEVVLRGRLAPEGHFQVAPDGVMAKCPSKYEAKKN